MTVEQLRAALEHLDSSYDRSPVMFHQEEVHDYKLQGGCLVLEMKPEAPTEPPQQERLF